MRTMKNHTPTTHLHIRKYINDEFTKKSLLFCKYYSKEKQ